ncbi:Uncharacterized conserved protein, DUF885 familyt [Maribacter sedimenticola]|uniref:Uncharacterized conserved protein, DUF885 familyt n=1 Tax=Maribacter sedimenticola TaxID=228956 RepID=A0ABY1SLM1_9FLAO|nr:DUF885 domain-containing protein [Maribacter sedimenticola]SNR76604.1 Uncharacterized conserved protein, DUF885 familyt [Maribacter sedimenticola]
MKKILIVLVFLLGLISQAQEIPNADIRTNPTTHNVGFITLLVHYYDDGLKLNPLNATFQGDSRYNDTLPNFLSDAYKKELKDYYTSYLKMSKKFDDKKLSETERMSNAILQWECEINLDELAFEDYTPIDQMWSMNLMMGQLAGGTSAQPFNTVEDYTNWLKRLDDYVVWLDTAKNRMQKGIKAKNVLPKSLIKKVLPQLQSILTKNIETNLFFSPILNFPDDFSTEDRERLKHAYTTMISDKIIPAYKTLHDFMATDYLSAGRTTSGIQDIPNGKAYYAHQIKKYTTTSMSAEEIHKIGLSEVARISTEMEKVKQQVGFKGNLKEFFDHVRTKKELMPFTDPQQVIDNFNTIHKKITPRVNELFSKQPNTPFEVRRTESFREASASAEYNPGSLDGTRPGIFYVPIPDVTSYNMYSDEDLFLHEAIPGHHFQISLTQENNDLPQFRKTLWYSAYGEGWALYTESLGKELGLYTDPYQYFGMLGAEMHRAVRLVVDTGLHAKGWTREQAIAYSLDNEAESEASITAEIERYMANPGQALSYKIGQLKILELRAKAEKMLGKDFDIKVFHEKILETGCVPLAILESKITEWINANMKF